MLASGVAELISLGSVLPFLGLISNPELLWQEPIVQALATGLGINDASQLLIPATLIFAGAAVIAALIRLLNLWLNGCIAAAIGSDLSCECYRRTLYQPYSVHVQRNSATVIAGITSQIANTVGALNALLLLMSSAVVAIALFAGLLFINTPVALLASALFGVSYFLLGKLSRKELHVNGHKITLASGYLLKALNEGLGSIRDVLLDNSQGVYLQVYQQADRPQRQLQAKNAFLGAFPRYAVEALGMVFIAFLGSLLVLNSDQSVAVIPLLGALALGAQRLLPALQTIYNGWAVMKGYNSAISAVLEMLNQPIFLPPSSVVAWDLHSCIRLEGVNFRYGIGQPIVLKGLSLEIRRGECIGLIGSTGSGKSTVIDLVMGLLEPTSGKVIIDGLDIHDSRHPERIAAWRGAISHVPQNIYMSDSSVTENIAFGVPKQLIDFDRVKRAAEQAQISSFIEEMPQSYQTFVGEQGIRLSGGQRQRIGIARALYKNSKVLIFDEATSSLDTNTENSVMQAINGLSESLTIVMIAHRLSTLLNCDRVIRLENGIISADGSPQEVIYGAN